MDAISLIDEHGDAVALLVSVILALVGYLVAHWTGLRQQRVRAQYDYVSAQVERLYGPLYSLVQSNNASWATFRKSFRPNAKLFDPDAPFSEREVAIWRAWAEHVFIPSNLKIRDVIEHNAHLVEGGRMPEPFKALLAHVESSKLVLPSLADGDLDLLDQFPPWPDDFNDYVDKSYQHITAQHQRLLGRIGRGARFTR